MPPRGREFMIRGLAPEDLIAGASQLTPTLREQPQIPFDLESEGSNQPALGCQRPFSDSNLLRGKGFR